MNILIADDQYEWREPLAEFCKKSGHEVVAVSDGDAVIAMPQATLRNFDVALLDYKMPTNGLEAGTCIRRIAPEMMLVMLTAHADSLVPEKVVAAMRAGFYDYLDKNSDYKASLQKILEIAIDRKRTKQDTREVYRLDQIVGESPKILELRKLIQNVAPTNATVLILGESGTGKELVAGALHSLSVRRQRNYIRINCAAIPENLLESELFGHEKGAFTGAIRQKLGRVEEADGGTIFLDEIGDMSRSLQAKLLRFLEDGSFIRVGGNDELKVNVRLIAATNRDIIEAIGQNNFREDLFHRLNVVNINPTPLRERGGDIILLAENFLRHYNTLMNRRIRAISPAAREKLLGHHWPGNVRELRNVIERAVILEMTAEIMPQSLPDFSLVAELHKAGDVGRQRTSGDWGGTSQHATTEIKVGSGAGAVDVLKHSPFWEGLRKNGFRLWTIAELESVRRKTREALGSATLKEVVREPAEPGAKMETSERTRKVKTRRLDGFTSPPAFTVRFIDPRSGNASERDLTLDATYHPEPNYIKLLYQQGRGSNIENHVPEMVSAVCRYAVEHKMKSLRDGLRAMTETVIDEDLASAVMGDVAFITGERNLWEKESKGSDGAFRDLSNKFKTNHPDIHDRIEKYFPDYKRPTP